MGDPRPEVIAIALVTLLREVAGLSELACWFTREMALLLLGLAADELICRLGLGSRIWQAKKLFSR